MYFNTKKEVLEYLGKNSKDTKLVDRMIDRGEIIKSANGYEVEEKRNKSDIEQIKQLKQRIIELEEELRCKDLEITWPSLSDLEVAQVQWAYYEKELQKMILLAKHIILITYEKHKAYYEKCNIDKFEYKDQLVSYAKEKAKIDSVEWFC